MVRSTESFTMKGSKKTGLLFLFCLLMFSALRTYGQAPMVSWEECAGGTREDAGNSILQTNDGNYIVAGKTNSDNGPVTGNHGGYDVWVVKYDTSGIILWQKCLGGSGNDEAGSILQTSDGGFVIAGYTESFDGDVVGIHFGVQSSRDAWVVKLDNSGNVLWQKCLGGSEADEASTVLETSDGNLMITGFTRSMDGDVIGNHSATFTDFFLILLSGDGSAILHQKCIGGQFNDRAYSSLQTTDGGFLIAGSTDSNTGDVSFNHGSDDFWVVKVNESLAIEWEKTYGGSNSDKAKNIISTLDGNYLVSGDASSNDGDVSGHYGSVFNSDFWMVKINPNGAIIWQHSYGGTNKDVLNTVIGLYDGSYIAAGTTNSLDGDVTGLHTYYDGWILRTDAQGNLTGQLCLGSAGYDEFFSLLHDSFGNTVLAGTGGAHLPLFNGGSDTYLVKLKHELVGIEEIQKDQLVFTVSPNPIRESAVMELSCLSSCPDNEYSFVLADVQGRIVYRMNGFRLGSAVFKRNELQNGIYFFSIVAGGTTYLYGKLLLLK